MKILAFGKIAEIVQSDHLEWAAVRDTDVLRKELESNFPDLKGMDFKIAVDKKIVSDYNEINEGSEIALLPPFSGG